MHHVRDFFAATPFAGISKAADGSDAKCRFVNGLESASWRAPSNVVRFASLALCSATARKARRAYQGLFEILSVGGAQRALPGRMLEERSQIRPEKRAPNLEADAAAAKQRTGKFLICLRSSTEAEDASRRQLRGIRLGARCDFRCGRAMRASALSCPVLFRQA